MTTPQEGHISKKNAEVEVLYEGTWWRARIKFKHRGKYAVIYHDENSCEEGGVTADRIREYVNEMILLFVQLRTISLGYDLFFTLLIAI